MDDHRALDREAERVLRGERECLAGVDSVVTVMRLIVSRIGCGVKGPRNEGGAIGTAVLSAGVYCRDRRIFRVRRQPSEYHICGMPTAPTILRLATIVIGTTRSCTPGRPRCDHDVDVRESHR